MGTPVTDFTQNNSFQEGDKVYWVHHEGEKQYGVVESVDDHQLWLTNGGLMPIDRVFQTNKDNSSNTKETTKNINMPLFGNDIIDKYKK